MKHTPKITVILLLLFLISQLFGLLVINKYIVKRTVTPAGKTNVSWKEIPYVERPQVNETTSFVYVLIGIIIGTILLLLLIKMKAVAIWKTWYFVAIFLSIGISLAAFLNKVWTILLALILSFLKTVKPNVFIHNLTEPLVYAGIAALLIPVFNIPSALILLLLISVYDYLAVNKIKHMVTLAKFQTSQNNFAGIMIPYAKNRILIKQSKVKVNYTGKKGSKVSKPQRRIKNKGYSTAILGGGDIALPLLFAGTVLKYYALTQAFIVVLTATIALAYLLYTSKEKKFYPAMPFLTIGCLVGYLIVLLTA